MRIFGHVMLGLLFQAVSVFAIIVFVLKWTGNIDYSWLVACLPMVFLALLRVALTIVQEGITAIAKNLTGKVKSES